MEKTHSCTCCTPRKTFCRSDILAKHRKKYDPSYIDHFSLLKIEREKYEINPKPCMRNDCAGTIPFKERLRQNFCSSSCSAIVNNTGRILSDYKKSRKKSRFCRKCDNIVNKKNSVYCSVACYEQEKLDNKQIRIDDWKKGLDGTKKHGELAQFVKDYLREQADHKCSECGWSRVHPVTGRVPLQIDHIDGNFTNNIPSNLRVLCGSCHSLTPNYGSLNTGNGRGYRKK